MKTVAFLKSAQHGARRIGWGPYLRYRLRSFRGARTLMHVVVSGARITVRTGTPDLRVALQSLGSEFSALSKLLPEDFDGVIVDAGGYIGTAAITLSRMYPKASVVTIEPSTSNLAVLRKNVAPYTNIHPVNAALCPKTGATRLPLRDRGTGEWGFTVVGSETPDGVVAAEVDEVDVVTLDDIAQMFRGKPIGLIKLDIEGGEHALFEADDPVLREIPAIFVELHDRIVPGCSEAFYRFGSDRWILGFGGEKLLALHRDAAAA